MDLNLKAPFLLSLHAGRAMRAHGAGKIVNVADWAGSRPYRGYLPYCVSKAGVLALTQALAKEFAPEVQVNAVAPGPVLLPDGFGQEERERVLRRVPLRRMGSPEDVANAVLFLVEGTDFATGSVVAVDGGQGIV
jgi:pteridine reductase